MPPPGGLPDSFLEPVARRDARRSCAATRAPTGRSRPRSSPRRYGVDLDAGAAASSSAPASWSAASCCPGGSEREWCDADVLRRVRRASVAALRQEAEAVDPAELARFLPAWQNVDAHRPAGAGPDRLREALVPLQGVALTPEVWERDVLPRRLGAYSPTWLDQLTTSGEIVWIGAGALARTGRVALYFREDVRLAGPPPVEREARAARGRGARRDPRAARGGAVVLARPRRPSSTLEREELHAALWDLAWAGEVTNDAFAPLRARRLTRGRRATAARPPLRLAPRPAPRRRSSGAGR